MIISQNKKTLFVLGALVVAAGTIFYVKGHSAVESVATGLGKTVREDLIQRVTVAGIVAPARKTIITAPYNGYVKKLFVKIGDKVKKGDPVVSVVQSLVSSDNVYPIRSPYDGVVVQVEKSEGEYVKEGDAKEFILRIDDMSKLYVLASAPEIDRVKLKADQEATIKASAILNRSYKGVIRELSLAAREKEQWSRSQVVEFPIKIEITDQDATIKPGMSVVIDVTTEKKEKALTLRHEFIRRENEQRYVILKDGRRQNIKVGLQNEEAYEILDGLKEGDMVKQVDFAQLSQE